MDERKRFWMCQKGHVLGVVARAWVGREVDGVMVRYFTNRLVIFREAVPLGDLGMDEVLSLGVEAGSVDGTLLLGFSWRCSVDGCGCVKPWFPDDAALDWLRRRYARREGSNGEVA
jgi:hypothetical protein